MGLILTKARLHSNLGQVVHTCLPLSPSSITWYGDVLCLGMWPQAWRRVIAAYHRGWLKVTCRLTACTLGSTRGTTLGNKYGRTLPFAFNTALYTGTCQTVWLTACKTLSVIEETIVASSECTDLMAEVMGSVFTLSNVNNFEQFPYL